MPLLLILVGLFGGLLLAAALATADVPGGALIAMGVCAYLLTRWLERRPARHLPRLKCGMPEHHARQERGRAGEDRVFAYLSGLSLPSATLQRNVDLGPGGGDIDVLLVSNPGPTVIFEVKAQPPAPDHLAQAAGQRARLTAANPGLLNCSVHAVVVHPNSDEPARYYADEDCWRVGLAGLGGLLDEHLLNATWAVFPG